MLFFSIVLFLFFSAVLVASADIEAKMEKRIVEEAIEQGVNPDLAVAVARCESGLNQGIKNKNSSASGIFQFIRSTWKDTLERMDLPPNTDVFDGEMNIVAGVWLMKQDGAYTHWFPSYKCWRGIM